MCWFCNLANQQCKKYFTVSITTAPEPSALVPLRLSAWKDSFDPPKQTSRDQWPCTEISEAAGKGNDVSRVPEWSEPKGCSILPELLLHFLPRLPVQFPGGNVPRKWHCQCSRLASYTSYPWEKRRIKVPLIKAEKVSPLDKGNPTQLCNEEPGNSPALSAGGENKSNALQCLSKRWCTPS